MSFEEAIKNPNKRYILKQRELLNQAKEDYDILHEEVCMCNNSIMIADICEMCFNNEPLNIKGWLLILGTMVNGENIKNIWAIGDFIEES